MIVLVWVSVCCLLIMVGSLILWKRKIIVGVWSIKVFTSTELVTQEPAKKVLKTPTLKAEDVTDIPAEFIADPFILYRNGSYYMFFEVLDKTTMKGVISFAHSEDGHSWKYGRMVLEESYHLSYPYVFEHEGESYMIPETIEAGKILLYKAKQFPDKWEIVSEMVDGKYADPSLFYYNQKWWMFASKQGQLHLFHSNSLTEHWTEHPKSPLIRNDHHVTRLGGRVIVDNGRIYRYTQDGQPTYGHAVRVFEITDLSESSYQENEINLVLNGTKENDWRRDGMHSIDQVKTEEDKWLIAVDGHRLETRPYLLWKLDYIRCKYGSWLWKSVAAFVVI